jgi:hypothetical protein
MICIQLHYIIILICITLYIYSYHERKVIYVKHKCPEKSVLLPSRQYDNIQQQDNLIYSNNIPTDHVLPLQQPPIVFNVPTRGFPLPYSNIGVIKYNNKIYNLFGRMQYPGSSLYDYYVEAVIENNVIRVPINNDRELFTDDKINVPFDNNLYDVYIYPLQYRRLPL